jgi:tRNA A37 threonylcarbamoyladenosine synthetase subunit TsaC/SUA5/YrdC
VGAEIDAGTLPGIPSTVVDITGGAAVVLRAGAVPAAEVLARIEGLR